MSLHTATASNRPTVRSTWRVRQGRQGCSSNCWTYTAKSFEDKTADCKVTNRRNRKKSNKVPWSDSDRALSLICGNKMPTRCNRWYLLQILLHAQHVSGQYYVHHQELESIIQMVAACGIWCFGFQVVGMMWSWRLCVRFAGCCFTCWACDKICNKYHLLHLVDILFPHNKYLYL